MPCNFEEGTDWVELLEAAGMDRSLPTVVTIEGVLYYLEQATVEGLFSKIRCDFPGATLICNSSDRALNPTDAQLIAMQKSGEPQISGIAQGEGTKLMERMGYEVKEVVEGPQQMCEFMRKDGLGAPPWEDAITRVFLWCRAKVE